ncbi:uncharacterized protein LOC128546365 [Mercenaria mercenaria]|uniref:uncharacterized protein LOC128546365 n=1 Tax=Mercenaria mercenaria TaxID=6596 RepID=UPI00234EC286|nr:uncharacterized protein LOC128546365 [Mercenaria mercenaria]
MEVTNKNVFDFFKLNGRNKTLEYIREKCNTIQQDACISPTDKAVEYTLKRLTEKTEKLSKNKHRAKTAEELRLFMDSDFNFPKGETNKRGPQVSVTESLNLKDSLLQEKINNETLIEKVARTETILLEKEQVLGVKTKQLDSCRLNLKRTAARETYAQNKIKKLEENEKKNCCEDSAVRISELENKIKEKDKEIGRLEENMQYLNDILQDIDQENRIINVFDEKSRRYSPKFKNCVYELLKLNVSASKVGEVVKSVLKLVSVEPNRTPSSSTVLEMNLQRLCLAQKQLGEVFSNEENTCILTDETSKFGSKFMGYEATDSHGNFWVLGLREIETKSASNTLKVLQEILNDLDSAASNNNVSRDIITHITATMSDRAATEVRFNELLQQYRKEILPLTYHNYHLFTEEEKSSLESLNNYFCGLHALVNYAETAQKCLVQLETNIFDDETPIYDKSFRKSDEPGTCRLVRTASKAFGEGSGADEKSGCQGSFRTFSKDFLQENGLKSMPLKSYRGSRFNILFNNAATLFFLHEKMLEFLQSFGAENRLLKAVLFDLKVPEFVAGTKALGLISKVITCPLWCILEDRNISVTEMNTKYLELVSFLQDATNNTEDFMTGNLEVFSEHVKKDCIYLKLVKPSAYDQACHSYLKVILAALCTLCKKLYKEHLPGGSLITQDENKFKGVPKTSCFAESVFGQLDQLMRTKPNLKTLAAESFIMFLNNRTLHWLNSKEENERHQLITQASKEVKLMKVRFKSRLLEIEENRRIAIQEKILKRENAERERIRKQELYTENIMKHGLWQSQTEVDNMLASYEKTSEKVEVLKAQLKFRKDVLNQVAEVKSTFNFTKTVEGKKSRKSLSVEELASNLKLLVRQAVVKDQESNEAKHLLVGKRVRHRFDEIRNGQKVPVWYTGKVISQVPLFNSWFNIIYDGDDAVYTYHRLDSDLESEDLEILV